MALNRAAVAAAFLAVIAAAHRPARAGGELSLPGSAQLFRRPRARGAMSAAVAAVPAPGAAGARMQWSDRLRLIGSQADVAGTRGAGPRSMPGRMAAGFRLGYVTDLHKMASPAALADVSLRLPFGRERLEAGAEVGAWSHQLREAEDGTMVTRSLKVMPLRARLIYEMPVAGLALFGGVGCGVVLTRTEIASAGAGVASARKRAATAGALLGARLRAGRGRLGLELGWWRASLDGPDLQSSIAGLELSAGYALSF